MKGQILEWNDGKGYRRGYKPISVQHEGKFPNHETVLFSLNDPDWVIHRASNRCQTEHPHHITECKEFESEENTLWKST